MKDTIRINTEREHIYSPDIHVGITAKISGRIEDICIIRALEIIQHRHPLLTSTILFDENHAAYYKLNSSGHIMPKFVDSEDPFLWINWIKEQNHDPFDFENGPLMKVLVIKSKSSTTIAALGHHLLGDGISFVYFMRDLLMILDGKPCEEQLFPAIIQNNSDLPREAKLKLVAKLYAKKINQDYLKTGKHFSYDDYKTLYHKYNQSKEPALKLYSFTARETQTLMKACKSHQVTVNEAITTAFLAARRNAGIQSDKLGVSCNIRNQMTKDPKESMGNYVSGILVKVKYNETLDFWTNTVKTRKLLKHKLKNTYNRMVGLSFINALDDSLIDAINFTGFCDYKNSSAHKLCDIVCGVPYDEGLGISNLGKFNISFDNFSLEELCFIPPLFASEDFIVGVFTVNNIMRFCLRFSGVNMAEEDVDKLFLYVKKVLFEG